MATATPAAAPAAAAEAETVSSISEPVECVCVKTFFDEDCRTIAVGQTYVYKPKEGQPFPYGILHPKDEKLNKVAKAEAKEAKSAKLSDIAKRKDILAKLAAATA